MAKLITITFFTNHLEAHIAKGRLEAEGIQTFIANEHSFVPSSDIEIQVLKEDKDKAQRVITSYLNGEYQRNLNQSDASNNISPCPQCSSRDFKNSISLISILSSLLSLCIIPLKRNKHTCLHCGHKWIS